MKDIITLRDFPRYDTFNMKGRIVINDYQYSGLILKNVSLAGFQIESPQEIILNKNDKVDIYLLEKRCFQFITKTIWTKAINESSILQGQEIYFEDQKLLKRWLQILKAIHIHQNKQTKEL